jgi:hypothetical protein
MMDVTHGLPASSPVAADDALVLVLLSCAASLALALALLSDALALEPFPDELAELPVFPPQETSAKAITKAKISAVIFL